MNSFKSRSILLLYTFFLLAGAYFSVSSLYPAHHLAIKEQPAHFHMVDGLPPAHQAAPPALPLCAPPKDFLLKDCEHELAELHTELISLIQQKKTASAIFKAIIKQYRVTLLDPALLNAISPIEKNVLSELAQASLSPHDLSSHNISGHTLLHKSIHSNHPLATQFLIPLYAQANLLNTLSEQGETPLMLAVKYNNFALAKLCLDAGAHPNIPDASGKTPLQVTREKNFIPLVKLITAAIQQQHALSSEIEGEPHPSLPSKENPYEQIEGIAPWDEKHTGEALQNTHACLEAAEKNALAHKNHNADKAKHMVGPLNVEGEIDSEEEPGIPVDTKHAVDVKETAEAALNRSLSNTDNTTVSNKGPAATDKYQVTDDGVKNVILLLKAFSLKNDFPRIDEKSFPLIIAAAKDDIETLKTLIAAGIDITQTDNNGFNALHYAASYGNNAAVNYLIPHFVKANLFNAQSERGKTALILAAEASLDAKGTLDVLKTLINGGADITKTDNYGLNALHCAALQNKPSAVRLLAPLFAEKGLLNAQINKGETALIMAAEKGLFECVKALIESAVDITKRDNNGLTALHYAALKDDSALNTKEKINNKIAIVQYLRDLFVKANLIDAQTINGTTTLMLAAANGLNEIVKILIDAGADITKTDKQGFNALLHAAHNGNNATVQYLIPHFAKAKLLNVQNNGGDTALLWAAGKCDTDVVKELINAGAEIGVTEKIGLFNALHVAAEKGRISTIEYLVKPFVEANLLDAPSIDGETALILAAANGLDTVVKVLIDAGADITKTDKDGLNALHHAARNSKIATALYLAPYFEKHGLLTAKTKSGSNALMEAANPGGFPIQHFLLPYFAKAGQLNVQTTDDNITALMCTAANGNEAIVKAFIDAGADITKADKSGFTALHYAISHNNVPSVKLLASRLANVANNACATPLIFACAKGNINIVKILLPFSIQAGLLNAVYGENKHTALSAARLAGHDEIIKILKEAGAK